MCFFGQFRRLHFASFIAKNQFFVESYDIVTTQEVFRAMARITLTLIPLVMAWLCIVPMADGQDAMVSAR
jgi:hypothetical protein